MGNNQRELTLSKRILTFTVSLLLFPCLTLSAAHLPLIRISVENTLSHVQTQAVEHFAQRLSERLKDQYEIQFYPAATLYKDSEVFRALSQGKLEIAVPGTWQFDRYVSEVGVFQLPSLYGRTAETTYALLESEVGTHILEAIEHTMNIKVLGRFIDLGAVHLFSTKKPIKTAKDIIDQRIRVAGGEGNILRLEALGAKPVTIAWPDLPLALTNGNLDAALTSYETLASAKLWNFGIRYVYEDSQYFAQYIPIASFSFWQRLPSHVQQTILDCWEEGVDKARREAFLAQERARIKAILYFVNIIQPDKTEVETTRTFLQTFEKDHAEQMGIPVELYEAFTAFLHDYKEEP